MTTRVLGWPDQYLFLFSHMRSYSSVLSHVLGSHPDIAGYCESHLKYRHGRDLSALRWHVTKSIGALPSGRYLLDKLLHNYMLIPRSLRTSRQLRVLIFPRRPAATLQSILRMHAREPRVPWHGDPAAVAVYYCERLTWIAAVGVLLKDRALAFPAEAITCQTSSLLGAITTHLQLTQPLSPIYKSGRYTGQPGCGDMSSRIHEGRILETAGDAADDACPGFSAEQLQRCERTYRRCLALLVDWCPSFGLTDAADVVRPLPAGVVNAAGSGR